MLSEKLAADLINAQKNREETKVSILRFLLSRLKYVQIEKGHALSDEEITTEISKEVKRHKESIDAFTSGGRTEMASKEQAELAILQEYLPQQLSETELAEIVQKTITEVGATTKADMGKVIGSVMAKVKGQADGGAVSQLVKQELEG